jgi:hypothetical protein
MPFNRPIPDSKPSSKPSTAIQGLVQAEKLMQIALVLPSSACIGWLAGAWADSHFHQSWIGITGCIFGGISGLVYVVRLAIASAGTSANGAGTENGNGKGSPDKP